MPSREIDEILEIIWMKKELGQTDLCAVENEIKNENLENLVGQAEKEGWINIQNGNVYFTATGEKAVKGLIRRHRLAERLLVDVFETQNDKVEEPACQFEHMVSEEVTDAICTILGHPKVCPHGLPIPEGKCCLSANKTIETLIVSLDKAEIGEWVTIAYVVSKKHERMHKLMSFGIAPGVKIKVHQKYPAFVVQVEEMQIAFEEDIVKEIFVRRK
ncbi:MAG: hypothetical protein FD145_1207 [Candidatus Saganbacteria bacterium]|uniref:Ferrous iron transporter FeoA-like domain-containing protein n=1 Tax=Candidatus Saganbacteria bacterium TaxID=2575572 RepID=A0A833NZN8_UNCSA|nr:MAG: hypothetical protein FD145_1207 [Candidatus Saganbacteria bacterium]